MHDAYCVFLVTGAEASACQRGSTCWLLVKMQMLLWGMSDFSR